MAGEGGLSDLLPTVYDAAIEPEQWPEVLGRLAGLFGASYGGLVLGDPALGIEQIGSVGSEPSFSRSYRTHFGRMDPVVPEVIGAPVGTMLTDTMVMPKAAMERTEFYQDWVRPQGLHSVLAGNLVGEGGTVSVALVSRSRQEEEFRQADLELFSIIAPHLQRAVKIQLRLRDLRVERSIALDALDRLAHGILVTDEASQVLLANRIAEQILGEADGLGSGRSGLYTGTATQTNQLRHFVARAAGAHGRMCVGAALLIDRPSTKQPFQVLVSPLRAGFAWLGISWKTSGALIVIVDPERQPKDVEVHLKSLFGLTRTEARVARGIAAGEGLVNVAESLGIFPSTARTHLHRIFEKTQTRRQAELAKMVERLAILGTDEG
jgi:DNA-binding CsgD family transcriptional regulator